MIKTNDLKLTQKLLGIYDNMGGSAMLWNMLNMKLKDLKGLLADMFGWCEIHW